MLFRCIWYSEINSDSMEIIELVQSACLRASLVLMPVQMAETWPLLFLHRLGNKASSWTCKDQITCMANVLETMIYKSRNARTGGDTPGPLLVSGLCDDWSTFMSEHHVIVKHLTCRNFWCQCMHWLFKHILALLTTYISCCWNLVNVLDSTAESANCMSTCDNHVVGVMSRFESNKSRCI